MVRCITEVDENCFGMTDMKEAVRLWRESCPDLATSCFEMFFAQVRVDLGIPTRCMELTQETFLEDRFTSSHCYWFGDCRRAAFGRFCFLGRQIRLIPEINIAVIDTHLDFGLRCFSSTEFVCEGALYSVLNF